MLTFLRVIACNYFHGSKSYTIMTKIYLNFVLFQELPFYKDRANAVGLLEGTV